jgi:PAS domain S-box-containing protein
LRILLVGDSAVTCQIVGAASVQLAVPLTVCADVTQGWETARQEGHPLLVVDRTSSGGDGLELCRRVRSLPRGSDAYILVLADGDVSPAAVAALMATGADDYLAAPIDAGTLALRLEMGRRLVTARIERRRADEERLATQAVLEHALDGISRLDERGVFVMVNPSYAGLLGCRPDDLVGQHWSMTVHPDDHDLACASYERMRATGKADFEARALRRDGSCFYKHVVMVRATDRLGRFVGHHCFMRDVTEQRRMVEEIARSERLASIGRLAAGIAHEINNPVAGILMAAEVAVRAGREPGGEAILEAALRQIMDDAKRCGRIAKSVLQFARQEVIETWPADLNEVVRRARDLTRHDVEAHHARLALELADHLPQVPLNPTAMEQVLVNLVRNAVQSGGTDITVTVRTEQVGDRIRLSVEDDGPGMPEDVMARIFDPFFTTRRERGGTGLGLSLAHGLVQEHGGTITVESLPGRGTTLAVDLPLAGSEQSGAAHGESAAG